MKHLLHTLVLLMPLFLTMGCGSHDGTVPKNDEELLKILDLKLDKHPNDDELLYERSQVYMRLDRPKDAVSDLVRATTLKPKEVKYFLALGDAYFAFNGDVENSYAALQRAIDLDPENPEAYLKMGELTYYSRDYDRAMENLSKVTAKDPNNRTALFMKGFIYKETGDTAKAVTLLNKVCSLYPDYEPAFEELGILYATHGNSMAVEYLNTAIRLEPNNTNALYALAMYYQDNGKWGQAETLYKKILDINANHKDAWHNRGYIALTEEHKYNVACQYFSRAIQCDSSFVEAWVNRGYAFELQGNKKQAKADYQSALTFDAACPQALQGLKRL